MPDVPEFVYDHVAKLSAKFVMDEPALDGLVEMGAGKCDDCAKDSVERVKFGSLAVCRSCGLLRERVRLQVEEATKSASQ